MVSSWVVPQKLAVERPRGSNLGTIGFSFFARVERSSKVSMLRAVETGPWVDGAVKAAAEPARMDAMASFMFSIA